MLLWTLASGAIQAASWPSVDAPLDGGTPHPQDTAIVVAIEDYVFLPDVPGARKNADAWVVWLKKTRAAGHVLTLYDQEATHDAIVRRAHDAASLAGPGGTVWVIFIGHGAPARDGTDGVLVGADAQQSAEGFYGRSLSRQDLIEAAQPGAGQVIAVLDACFSGRGTTGDSLVAGLQPALFVQPPQLPRATVITAAATKEFAGPLPGTQRPAFSYLALGALRGWGDADGDGRVTATEVGTYAQKTLLELLNGRVQTPQVEIPDGDRVLAELSHPEPAPDLTPYLLSALQAPEPIAAPASGAAPTTVTVAQVSVPTEQAPTEHKAPPADVLADQEYHFVTVHQGEFTMGAGTDEAHEVKLRGAYEIGNTEVTQGLYEAVLSANPSRDRSSPQRPVEFVSWYEAIEFCNALSRLKGLEPAYVIHGSEVRWNTASHGYRLPTEAEWEYAARSGRDLEFSGSDLADKVGWTRNTAEGRTHDVGDLRPTAWGLQDMSGNVAEWVWDYYEPLSSQKVKDPTGPELAYERVRRGGSYMDDDDMARVTTRSSAEPTYSSSTTGFRIARSL